MAAEHGPTIGVSGFRFHIAYPKLPPIAGHWLWLYDDVESKLVQLLRFDCFEQEPHSHYDPDGKNNRIFMNKARVSDPIAWTIDHLLGNATSPVRIAGHGRLAGRLDEEALTAAMPGIEKALRDTVPRG